MTTALQEFQSQQGDGIVESEVWEVQRLVSLADASIHLGRNAAKVLQMRKAGQLVEVQHEGRIYITAESLEARSGKAVAQAIVHPVKLRLLSNERRQPSGLTTRQVWDWNSGPSPSGGLPNIVVYSVPEGEIARIVTSALGGGVREITYTFRDPYQDHDLRQQSAILHPDCDQTEVKAEIERCCGLFTLDWLALNVRRRRPTA